MRLQQHIYRASKRIFGKRVTHVDVDIRCGKPKHEKIAVYVWENSSLIETVVLRGYESITYKQALKEIVAALKKSVNK